MSLRKRLLVKPPAAGGLVPSEHFGVMIWEGDGMNPRSVNGGKFGAAASFNGTSSIISTTGLKNEDGKFNNGVTISAWINIVNYTQDQHVIVRNKSTGSQRGISFNVASTGYANFQVTNGSNVDSVTSSTQISNNTWYHLVGVREPGATTNAVKLYINGSLDVQANGTITIASIGTFSEQLSIGNRQTSTARDDVNCRIDQLRIFTKALSSSEVSTLYAETVETSTSLDPLSEDTTDTLQVLGDSSCIATYRFENDETDLSGNYDGTGTAIQYAAGRYGQAAVFNGSTSFINTGITNTTIPLNSDFSVSAWINTNSSSGFFIAEGDFNSWNTAGFGLAIISGNRVELSFGNVAPSGGPQVQSSALAADTWYHIVGVVDIGNVLTLYVNGVSVGTDTITSSNRTSVSGGFNIGSDAGGYHYTGKLDQVRIFNKALSAAEVTTLYNENSLVASYRFEGNANDDMRAYDGTATNVTYEYGLNFTPDLVWVKERTSTSNNYVTDSSRTLGQVIVTDLNIAQGAAVGGISSLDTGGFTVGSHGGHNQNGQDYVAWCLKANGGTTSSNTDGSITSTVQANQDSGFSIVKYTSTSSTSTIGHGLSSTPELVILKSTSNTSDWQVYSSVTGNTKKLLLNTTAAAATSGIWNNTSPTSTVFTSAFNNVGDVIAYCFHSVEGFSKFGSYTGNGSTDGPIVETGFEPAFVMFKRTSNVGGWVIYDNKRNLINPRNLILEADLSDAERSYSDVDFLSNGFQIKGTNSGVNSNGDTFIYMAFAADPDTEAPTVAKSFSTVTYTGTGVDPLPITGLGFKPGLVWIKTRDQAREHILSDIVRGPNKELSSNDTSAEEARGVKSFDNDGFTLDNATFNYNNNGEDYVAWTWKADDNEPTINTEGSIDSLVSANANAGFSIVKYSGSDGTKTVGHGLSSAPEMIIIKSTTSGAAWRVYHSAIGNTKALELNGTAAEFNFGNWNNTSPTTSLFTVKGSVSDGTWVNRTGENYIAYCFHSVSGYSKFGSYTGNGSTTGPTVTTGFRPDFIMLKSSTYATTGWVILDSVRSGSVDFSAFVQANLTNAESDGVTRIETSSTGFQLTETSNSFNKNGETYIYMAFKIN